MSNADTSREASAASEQTAVHALVRVHGQTVAIPAGHVTRAIKLPPEMAQVPRRAGAIEGMLTLGSSVLPVISLARWLDPAVRPETSVDTIDLARNLVLLLRDGDACIGLIVEAVVGVQRIRPEQVQRLFHDDNPDELFESAALFSADGVPVSILEARRLMTLANVWVADAGLEPPCAGGSADAQTGARAPGPDSSSRRREAHATFRIADAYVALPALNVGELLRRPKLRDELPSRDGVLGIFEWRDRVVPVVDLTGVLHALPNGETPNWMCIVCDGDHAIGIVLHEVQDIVEVTADEGTPDHAAASLRSVVGRRLVTQGRTLQVIDMASLLGHYPETHLSVKGARPAQHRTLADPSAPAYMVFDAGGMFAAQIDEVQEVVGVPDELRPHLDAGVPTSLRWREKAVPVMPIADHLITMSTQSACQLIIVCHGERYAALPIRGVKAMVSRGVACRNRIRIKGRLADVISVETEDMHASYPVIELNGALR